MHGFFYNHINIYCYSTIDLNTFFSIKSTFTFVWCILFICFWFVYTLIMLNTLIFKSSVLFGIHTLLDKSFRVSIKYLWISKILLLSIGLKLTEKKFTTSFNSVFFFFFFHIIHCKIFLKHLNAVNNLLFVSFFALN